MKNILSLSIACLLFASACGGSDYLDKKEQKQIRYALQLIQDAHGKLEEQSPQTAQIALKVLDDVKPMVEKCLTEVPEEDKGPLEERKKAWIKQLNQTQYFSQAMNSPKFYESLVKSLDETAALLQKALEINSN